MLEQSVFSGCAGWGARELPKKRVFPVARWIQSIIAAFVSANIDLVGDLIATYFVCKDYKFASDLCLHQISARFSETDKYAGIWAAMAEILSNNASFKAINQNFLGGSYKGFGW